MVHFKQEPAPGLVSDSKQARPPFDNTLRNTYTYIDRDAGTDTKVIHIYRMYTHRHIYVEK